MSAHDSAASQPPSSNDTSPPLQKQQQKRRQLQLYQIDAFTDCIFGGNPACVVPLQDDDWLSDDLLLKIAQENAVAETAFLLLPNKNGHPFNNNKKIPLRWFTPEIEMDLCGHATLASAHCLVAHGFLNMVPTTTTNREIVFSTASGDLTVQAIPLHKEEQDQDTPAEFFYQMDFPARMPCRDTTLPNTVLKSLSLPPKEVYKARDYILLYDSEEEVQNLSIVDRNLFDKVNMDPGGVCVTARANPSRKVNGAGGQSSSTGEAPVDFVSRFFTPQASILEDPVTGSSHCSLIPFWAERLERDELVAQQLSDRLGTLYCNNVVVPKGNKNQDDSSISNDQQMNRVLISGQAKTYSQGVLFLG
jgi:PhzF family phenazine biosynthesis protein